MVSKPRIESLDQFRGYTMAGMFLVNFLGSYWACPEILRHHHTYCSFADTIMPHFLFAVGFSLRLTQRPRSGVPLNREEVLAKNWRLARRLFGLVMISLILYTVPKVGESWQQLTEKSWHELLGTPLKRDWFQTLMHIALTSLWVLPVIRRRVSMLWIWMLISALLHIAISYKFYFAWVFAPPAGIDGGPAGFLTWTCPCLFGAIACEWIVPQANPVRLGRLLCGSALMMVVGWGLSCNTRWYDLDADSNSNNLLPAFVNSKDRRLAAQPLWPQSPISSLEAKQNWTDRVAEPPFVPPPGSRAAKRWRAPDDVQVTWSQWWWQPATSPPSESSHQYRLWNYWMMSQRAGTLSYLVFAAGFSGLVFALIYLLTDCIGWQLSVFRTLGRNALAGYVIHILVEQAVSRFVPQNAPAFYLTAACGVYFVMIYLVLRSLEKQNLFIRL